MANPALQSYIYRPAGLTGIFKGELIQGVSEAGYQVTRSTAMFSVVNGIDGGWSYVKSNNFSGTIVINLHQTSPSNDIFNAFLLADEVNESGSGAFFLKDASGREVVTALNARFEKRPDMGWTNGMSDRVYTLISGNIEITGGSTG